MRAMRALSATLLLSVFAAVGCAGYSPSGPDGGADFVAGLSVQVLAGAVAPGTAGTLRVQNASALTAIYGPCHIYFERWSGTRYQRLSTATRVCAAVSYSVAAGTAQEREFGIPAEAERGTYRLAVEFASSAGHPFTAVYSNEFDVP